jgi:hypothetical protein
VGCCQADRYERIMILPERDREREVTLAISVSTSPYALTFLAPLLEKHLGERPRLHAMRGLAGPNHVIQLLLDGWTWVDIAQAAMGAFGAGCMHKLGSVFTENILKRLRQKGIISDNSRPSTDSALPKDFYENLAAYVSMAQSKGDSVTFGIGVEKSIRNCGVQVPQDSDLNDVLSTIFVISSVATEVESFLSNHQDLFLTSFYPDGQNADCSVKLCFTEDGLLRIRVVDNDNNSFVISFDAEGNFDPDWRSASYQARQLS